jgi:hypothetical protein
MRLLQASVLAIALGSGGCTSLPIAMDVKPAAPADYAELHFSSPTTAPVHVLSVLAHSRAYGDYGIQVGADTPMAEPLWLSPGWVRVTYLCADSRDSFDARIMLSRPGRYVLECKAGHALVATRLEAPQPG